MAYTIFRRRIGKGIMWLHFNELLRVSSDASPELIFVENNRGLLIQTFTTIPRAYVVIGGMSCCEFCIAHTTRHTTFPVIKGNGTAYAGEGVQHAVGRLQVIHTFEGSGIEWPNVHRGNTANGREDKAPGRQTIGMQPLCWMSEPLLS